MTEAKATRRRRRTSTALDIPDDLAAWFAGEPRPSGKGEVPWSALIVPDNAVLPERWQLWKAQHPGAEPPKGWEWIDLPDSPRHAPQWQLDEAHKMLRRRPR